MVLAHNLTAMNAQRQFNIVGTAKKKSTEKLSSGYKINRAADDAAGLTISEKMRSQIRGLHQASENCQDGVSLCQVADGALAETHEILQRINELSIQSANGTNSSSDRAAIQAEVKQLTDEIDRIATTTSFNERIFPLKIETNASKQVESIRTYTSPSGQKWVLPDNLKEKELEVTSHSVNDIYYNNQKISFMETYLAKGLYLSDTKEYTDEILVNGCTIGNTRTTLFVEAFDLLLDDVAVDDDGYMFFINKERAYLRKKTYLTTEYLYENEFSNEIKDKYIRWAYSKTNSESRNGKYKVEYLKATKYEDYNDNIVESATSSELIISIHAGSESDMTLKIPVNIVNATKKGLGLTDPEIDISTEDGATAAIDRVKNAIEIVSGYRSYFGATQNRLEHTIANLDNIVENTQAAESRIRDTDMATEMVNNTKLNILEQAVTSMMTQANQSTQGVLSLLQ